MIGGVINLCKIEENWDETLRMTASIRAGTVAPSALLRRLAAYPRQNALARPPVSGRFVRFNSCAEGGPSVIAGRYRQKARFSNLHQNL